MKVIILRVYRLILYKIRLLKKLFLAFRMPNKSLYYGVIIRGFRILSVVLKYLLF